MIGSPERNHDQLRSSVGCSLMLSGFLGCAYNRTSELTIAQAEEELVAEAALEDEIVTVVDVAVRERVVCSSTA